jgi:hypothetical protein
MRCPSCNKFATYDTSNEPEFSLDATYDQEPEAPTKGIVQVSGSCRLVLTAECCGDELKEANFDLDVHVSVQKSPECTCEADTYSDFEAECEDAEITDRSEHQKTRTLKDGTVKVTPIPYRYQRRFYGVAGTIVVRCGCGKTEATESFSDEIQASSMDELT